MQYRGNVVHFARMIGCAAAAALLVALPVAAHDRDDDRGRGHGHEKGHGHGHDADELAAELKALKARVSKLEGHLTREDVVGSYVIRTLQTALIANVQQPTVGRLEHLAMTGAMELNANGSFTLSARETGFNAIWQFPTVRNRVDRADTQGGTWTYADGVVYLTFDGGGEVVALGGAVGGRMFLRTESNPADGTTTLVLLVKRVQ